MKLSDGTTVRVPPEALTRAGYVQIGVRPEKIRIGGEEENTLSGVVTESVDVVAAGFVLKLPLAPGGSPPTLSVTSPAKPPLGVIVTS